MYVLRSVAVGANLSPIPEPISDENCSRPPVNRELLSLRALLVSVGAIHLATAASATLVALRLASSEASQVATSLIAATYSFGFLIGCFFAARPIANIG